MKSNTKNAFPEMGNHSPFVVIPLHLPEQITFWAVFRKKMELSCKSFFKKISCFHRFKYNGSCTYLFCLIDGNYQPMYIISVLNESTVISLLLWLLSKHYPSINSHLLYADLVQTVHFIVLLQWDKDV